LPYNKRFIEKLLLGSLQLKKFEVPAEAAEVAATPSLRTVEKTLCNWMIEELPSAVIKRG
jgi:hypothetical protein